jgi:hypothetical protein
MDGGRWSRYSKLPCWRALLQAASPRKKTPLAPNVVRIDTNAGGYLFAGQAVPETMRAAAKATLAAGYTHFRLSNVSSGTQTGTACSFGPGGGACLPLVGSQAGVTVTMFRANQAGAPGAFDAAQVLAKYSQ